MNIEVNNLGRHTIQSLTFLSRIPVYKWGNTTFEEIEFDKCAYTFPLAGVIIAALPALMLLVLGVIGVNGIVNVTIVYIALIVISGAIHEDGLADSVDGIGGGKNVEDKLKIMKDSRIGVYGTIALIISIALRPILLWQVISESNVVSGAVALMVIAALSRGAMIWVWSAEGIADDEETSLAQKFGTPDKDAVMATALLCVPAIIALAIFCGIVPTVIAILMAIGVTMAVGKICVYSINTIRGDNLGAVQQCCEIAMYIGLVAWI